MLPNLMLVILGIFIGIFMINFTWWLVTYVAPMVILAGLLALILVGLFFPLFRSKKS